MTLQEGNLLTPEHGNLVRYCCTEVYQNRYAFGMVFVAQEGQSAIDIQRILVVN